MDTSRDIRNMPAVMVREAGLEESILNIKDARDQIESALLPNPVFSKEQPGEKMIVSPISPVVVRTME